MVRTRRALTAASFIGLLLLPSTPLAASLAVRECVSHPVMPEAACAPSTHNPCDSVSLQAKIIVECPPGMPPEPQPCKTVPCTTPSRDDSPGPLFSTCTEEGPARWWQASAQCDYHCVLPGTSGITVLGGGFGITGVVGDNDCEASCFGLYACIMMIVATGKSHPAMCTGTTWGVYVRTLVGCWSIGCDIEECETAAAPQPQRSPDGRTWLAGDDFDASQVQAGDEICLLDPAVPAGLVGCLVVATNSVTMFFNDDVLKVVRCVQSVCAGHTESRPS